jgi:hypothetical protein
LSIVGVNESLRRQITDRNQIISNNAKSSDLLPRSLSDRPIFLKPQQMGVEELQAVRIELDGTPGMKGQQIGEIVNQLRLGERIDLVVEVLANPSDGAALVLDGFRT